MRVIIILQELPIDPACVPVIVSFMYVQLYSTGSIKIRKDLCVMDDSSNKYSLFYVAISAATIENHY